LSSTGSGSAATAESILPNPQILLKAFPLKNSDEVTRIKEDVKNHTIVILKITPLAQKSVDDLRTTIEELTDFTLSFGGDIARLGEERIVITPPGVKIWRGEKTSES
jgi:SepF-like predicted cell division protein (DUF552 family)